MNGLGMYAAQDGHALFHERIEAPLLDRIKVLEDALKRIYYFQEDIGHPLTSVSGLMQKIAGEALKKVSSPEELRNEVTKKEKPNANT